MSQNTEILRTKSGLPIPKEATQYLSFDDQGTELWEIEEILDQRVVNGKKEYMVKWRGWSAKYCTWEPEENFFEEIDVIKDFLRTFNRTNKKKVNKVIQKREKPQTTIKKKIVKKSVKKSQVINDEACEETKIVIQRFIMPNASTGVTSQESSTNNFWTNVENPTQNPPGFITNASKIAEFFVCKNTNDETTTQMMTDENDMNASNVNKRKEFFWNDPNQLDPVRLHDSDDELDGAFPSKQLEEMEADKLAEMMSCPFQIKSLQNNFSAPVMDNENDKIGNYRTVIEECFTYSKSKTSQPGVFRFKVAFYDEDNNLKGYDYFSYDEIQQKNWGSSLLDFFTQEITSEMARKGKGLTRNIKVI